MWLSYRHSPSVPTPPKKKNNPGFESRYNICLDSNAGLDFFIMSKFESRIWFFFFDWGSSDDPNLNKYLCKLKVKTFLWYLYRGVVLTNDFSWVFTPICSFCMVHCPSGFRLFYYIVYCICLMLGFEEFEKVLKPLAECIAYMSDMVFIKRKYFFFFASYLHRYLGYSTKAGFMGLMKFSW